MRPPKPFFHQDAVTLYHGDATEILQSFPENKFDLIFADPPYKLSNGGFTCHAGERVSVNKGLWDKSEGIEKDYQFHYRWIEACGNVLKPNGSLWISGTYHSIYLCGHALQVQGWHMVNDIVWFKPNAAPNLSCRMFTASHETLLWARKGKKAKHKFDYNLIKNWDCTDDDFIKKSGYQMRSVWALPTPKPHEKRYGKHPTQKPEALLQRIVRACSEEGDLVLDPFCGSGTTGAIALRNKRRFVGVEVEKEFLSSMAKPRLQDEL